MDTALGRPSVGMTRSLLARENRSNIGIVDPTKVLSRVLAMGAVASFAVGWPSSSQERCRCIGRYRRKHLPNTSPPTGPTPLCCEEAVQKELLGRRGHDLALNGGRDGDGVHQFSILHRLMNQLLILLNSSALAGSSSTLMKCDWCAALPAPPPLHLYHCRGRRARTRLLSYTSWGYSRN